MSQEANADLFFEDIEFPELGRRDTRAVFLITHSQAAAELTKERFADIVLEAILQSGQGLNVEKWVCSKERHRNGGMHFHMSAKLNRQKRWLGIKEYA